MALDENIFKKTVMAALKLTEAEYRADLALGDVEAWDSLGHLSLICAIESAFGLKFELEMIPEMKSLPLIRETLLRRDPT